MVRINYSSYKKVYTVIVYIYVAKQKNTKGTVSENSNDPSRKHSNTRYTVTGVGSIARNMDTSKFH